MISRCSLLVESEEEADHDADSPFLHMAFFQVTQELGRKGFGLHDAKASPSLLAAQSSCVGERDTDVTDMHVNELRVINEQVLPFP